MGYPSSRITKLDQKIVSDRVDSQDRYKHSLKGNRGQYVGFMGEHKFSAWCKATGLECVEVNTPNEDFMVNGESVDVKTKKRNDKTFPSHEGSITERTLRHQKPEYFVFASMVKDELVELVGWISYGEFVRLSRTMVKGEYQSNGMKMPVNCKNIFYSELWSMRSFAAEVKSPPTQTTDEWLSAYTRRGDDQPKRT